MMRIDTRKPMSTFTSVVIKDRILDGRYASSDHENVVPVLRIVTKATYRSMQLTNMIVRTCNGEPHLFGSEKNVDAEDGEGFGIHFIITEKCQKKKGHVPLLLILQFCQENLFLTRDCNGRRWRSSTWAFTLSITGSSGYQSGSSVIIHVIA